MRRSWLVTPYNSGHRDLFDRIWNYDLTRGTIAMGWAEIDNVAQCSEHELRLRLEQVYPNERIDNAFRSLTRFYKQVKRGDIFIARKGSRRVVGFGEVSDDQPYYDKIKDKERIPTSSAPWRAPHFRDVQWKAADVSIEPLSFSQFPIVELTTDRPYYSLIRSSIRSDNDAALSVFDMLLKQKGQIILYGPPGTGKTYQARRLALSLFSATPDAADTPGHHGSADVQRDEPARTRPNPLLEKVESFVARLPAVELREAPSMMAYYSVSMLSDRPVGLVWLEYPSPSTAHFTVHLRKDTDTIRYPSEIVRQIRSFKASGWGGYPSFMVKSEPDADNAAKLIEYAYHKL